jgi:hypothetical protein
MDAAQRIALWRKSSATFARDNFRFEPDAWQADAMAAWDRGDQRIALKACKGPGKTAILAILAWQFLATRLHPKVAATSISGDNLMDGLWTEMSKWQQKSPFLSGAFEWQKTRIVARDHPETWWAAARTWSRSADVNTQGQTLAGLHADNILFVLDETGGMPVTILSTAETALAAGKECRIIQAGNPIETQGALGWACLRNPHLWTVIEITADPDDPKRSPRISKEYAKSQIEQYGRDNPWVMANIFAKFPPSSPLNFIGTDLVEQAATREATCIATDPLVLGIEVARFGDDEAGICPRKGRDARTLPWEFFRNIDTMQLAARAVERRNDYRADAVFVDGGGVGGGVVDRCRQLKVNVFDVQFGARADSAQPRKSDMGTYANKAAEMWGRMREWLKIGAIPQDPILHAQLTSRRYAFVVKDGRDAIILEPKEDMKRRGLASPDRADALALTFAFYVQPTISAGGPRGYRGSASTVQHEYDPFNIPPDRPLPVPSDYDPLKSL